MTIFALKLFAVIFMLTDHLGILLYSRGILDYEPYLLMRTLGRFAFPAYAFLLAEGFRHLREDPKRLRSHAVLLLVLTVLSEPLFDFFEHGSVSETASQSVMFTLLLGFAGLWLAEGCRERPLLRYGIFLLAGFAGLMVGANYRVAGVLLVFACSLYLDQMENRGYGKRFLGVLAVMAFYYLTYCWSNARFGGPAALLAQIRAMGVYGIPHLLLVPILAAYRGELGYRNRTLHRCYQWFYPAHLGLLCLLKALL